MNLSPEFEWSCWCHNACDHPAESPQPWLPPQPDYHVDVDVDVDDGDDDGDDGDDGDDDDHGDDDDDDDDDGEDDGGGDNVGDDDDDDGDETTAVGRGEPRRGRVRGDRGDVCAECVHADAIDAMRARRLEDDETWING